MKTPHPFLSILNLNPSIDGTTSVVDTPDFFADLNLDQTVSAVCASKPEYNLLSYYCQPLDQWQAIKYRQQNMLELQTAEVYLAVDAFAAGMRKMREQLRQSEKLSCIYQKQSWFLDAADTYCNAVVGILSNLSNVKLSSPGWIGFYDYLKRYTDSDKMLALREDIDRCKASLSSVSYCLHIQENRIRVRKVQNEPDFCQEVKSIFAKFVQSAPKDYRVGFYEAQSMNQVEEKVIEWVARLFPAEFGQLKYFCNKHQNFQAPVITRFDREVQFYVAWLDYIRPMQLAGLWFCFPHVSTESKQTECLDGFDLALASQLVRQQQSVVCNDYYLTDPERIIVVSGPNQGGKTTFARAFGQLLYLARLGCCVPGRQARVFLVDQLFTHFEKEEKVMNLRGKLQDDLLRIRHILDSATANSLIIMNEIFTSTTLKDAVFLGTQIMQRIIEKDLLCVCVTFVEELASLSEKTVSMVSTIVPGQPELRTFKIVRAAAGGRVHAISLAEKHRVTYEWLQERIRQ